jgi:hypothetical protein
MPGRRRTAAAAGTARGRAKARQGKGRLASMPRRFKVGDHVTWNSETGRVSGTIIKVHTSDFDFKGYTHHASDEDPQYEIKSDKTQHIAAHKGSVLRKLHR